MRRGALVLAIALLCAGVVRAQMPDPRQMSGIPRPDGALPAGTVTVRLIRGQFTNPLPGETVELTGPAIGTRTAKSDASGRAEFDKLPSGARVKASATIGGEKLESQEFEVPPSAGIRLMLVATSGGGASADGTRKVPESTAVPGSVVLGQDSRFVIEMGDDGLNVFNILQLVNTAQTPVQTASPLVFELPDRAQGAGMLEGSTPNAVVSKGRVTVKGPFPPGNTVVQFAYSLPFDDETMTIRQKLPARLPQLTVVAQKVGEMQVSSPQISERRELKAEGQPYVLAQGPAVSAGDTVAITFSGLPHEAKWPRYLALVLAAAILAGGAFAARARGPVADAVARERRLHGDRERLLGQLATLEEQHRQQAIDEARYAARRQELVASLERIYAQLDHGAAA